MKKIALALAALATLSPAVASAQYYGGRHHQRYDTRYEFRGYDRAGNPVYAFRDRRDDRLYRYDNRRNRYYRYDNRQCRDGTTGAVVGAIAGGLLGRTIDRHGDRTTGTLLGAGGGALAGRAIDRNCR